MSIDSRYIVDLKGKKFVLWSGLIDAATNAGLQSIEVNLIQFPSAENGQLAIAQATATFEGGRFFTEIGDCGPGNCTPMIAAHSCRMACTRAKGRALRDALNIGETMFEELGPDSESQNGQPTNHGARTAVPRARHDPEDDATKNACAVCGEIVPAPVANAARKRFAEVLCITHGRERQERRAVEEAEAAP